MIAGDADHPDDYSRSLKRLAEENGVVLTGFIRGEKLNQLMTNAALFVIPSYHEGLPFALLEAMSYDLDVISSDIPANRLDSLEPDDFFPVGSVADLADRITGRLKAPRLGRRYNLDPYDWDRIARQTGEVYRQMLEKPAEKRKKRKET